jgi:hypothetical protein
MTWAIPVGKNGYLRALIVPAPIVFRVVALAEDGNIAGLKVVLIGRVKPLRIIK